jgi:hypothetical protein
MRFLKETGYDKPVDRELMEDGTIRMAVEICEEGAYTREELDAYNAYLDHIRIELGFAEAVEGYEKLQKVVEDKDRLIEELKKQLAARSHE